MTANGGAWLVDGVRTPIGRAGEKGCFSRTRADDLAVCTVRALLARTPDLDPEAIDDVILAATAQEGDQGLTLGRSVALLAGLPESVPGCALDRLCAGSLTAVATAAAGLRAGFQDVVLAGGVEHMGHHPMGEEVDPNPRFFAEALVDESAFVMGRTAENLHDEMPAIDRAAADGYALQSQRRTAEAREAGFFAGHVVRVPAYTDEGWRVVDADETPRPDTTLEALASLAPAFRPGGRVTAGNAAGICDGAGCLLLASDRAVEERGLTPRMRLVDAVFTGVAPDTMGLGPIPATETLLARNDLSIADVDAVELNEAFAVQCLAFLHHFGLDADDEKVNPCGGAIALGHPLAMSGARLVVQLAEHLEAREDARFGITTLCVGMGMGAALLWEAAPGSA